MVELRLKTSKEARAQLRSEAVDLCVRVPADPDPFCDAPFSSAPNYYSREEEAHYILDDIDTLLAEVERLRAGIAAIRRIEAAFAQVSMVEACRSINEISTVLGPLETK